MKDIILNLVSTNPKHYVKLIKNDIKLRVWVEDNSLISSSNFVEMIYSALFQISNICDKGNQKKFDRFSTGFRGCGPASICECTKSAISTGVSQTKLSYTDEKQTLINAKRDATMLDKYGVKFNSQRDEIKHIWVRPKIEVFAHDKLTDINWLTDEYINKKRTLVDIADELGVYYSTVAEYCKKFGFKIRQVTNYSLQEREVASYLTTLGIEYISNDWDLLETQEIDILIKKYNIGIEIDGLYWHSYHPSMQRPEDKTRHYEKTRLARDRGVDIIHVTDYEWIQKKSIIKSIIKSKLNLNYRVFARKCKIMVVDKKDEKNFLNIHHLQGHINSLVCYGLYLGNELLMIVSIGKSRFKNSEDYEILRVCSKQNITVVGGLSKLMNHIKLEHINSTFITYCDLSKSYGNAYLKSGFKYIENSSPGYFWTDGNTIVSRYKSQKSQLEKWLPTFDKELTERQNMFNAGYRIFWDCGNAIFKY